MRLVLILSFLFASWAGVAQAERRPNIVLIVADDLGYGDIGCYGNRENCTPNIDRLAAAGLRFTDFHSNGSMCTPTRAAMLTGQYQQRFGRKFDGPLSGKVIRDQGLPLAAVTFGEVFQQQGYATGAFGKWHLGYIPPWLPPSQGFDEFYGLGSGDGDHHSHINRWGYEDWWHNNQIQMEAGYTADLITKHGIRFMEAHQDEPFFLYLPHLVIHFPWQGPDDPAYREAGKNYERNKWGIISDPNNVRPHVRAMIESLDRSVGRLVATLERLKLTDNTLVVFTSDNGGYLHYGDKYHNISSNGPLRGQKGTLYEGGHRVPMLFYWPGKIAPGVTAATSLSVDLLPTFASLAGISVKNLQLDGVDLASLLCKKKPLSGRTLFWREDMEKAVRRGPWKLYANGDQTELYNLADDLGEKKDLSARYPEQVRKLLDAWTNWETDVNESAKAYPD